MSGKRRAKALSEEEKHLRGTQRSPWWMLVTFSVESKEARTRTSPWHTFFFSESVCRRYFRRSRTRWQSRITQNVHNHHSIHNILTLIGNKVVPTMHGLCNPAILHIFHPIVASPSTNSIQFRVCRLNSDAGRRLRTNSPRPPRPALPGVASCHFAEVWRLSLSVLSWRACLSQDPLWKKNINVL